MTTDGSDHQFFLNLAHMWQTAWPLNFFPPWTYPSRRLLSPLSLTNCSEMTKEEAMACHLLRIFLSAALPISTNSDSVLMPGISSATNWSILSATSTVDHPDLSSLSCISCSAKRKSIISLRCSLGKCLPVSWKNLWNEQYAVQYGEFFLNSSWLKIWRGDLCRFHCGFGTCLNNWSNRDRCESLRNMRFVDDDEAKSLLAPSRSIIFFIRKYETIKTKWIIVVFLFLLYISFSCISS